MANTLKTIVSKKKQRYVRDGYNLDLSYINERIIAMGFPADSIESIYRNSADEVKRFLDEKHFDHYKIYNLCSEKVYDGSKFYHRVANYPFDDHHPPDFKLINPFCLDVKAWLDADPDNVAVVHCKAGKGRTGVMICCFLLFNRTFTDAQGVLDFYGQKRTFDAKGVTIPSQRRYIHYYDRFLQRNLDYKPVKLYLRCIVLDPVPIFGNFGTDCNLNFVVRQRWRKMNYESKWYVMRRTDRQFRLEVDPPLLLSDDVKIEFSTKPRLDFVGIRPKMWRKSNKEFHFWFNTYFVDSEINGGLAHDILPYEFVSDEDDSAGTEGCDDCTTTSRGQNPSFNEFCVETRPQNNPTEATDEGGVEFVAHPPNSAELVRRMSENATADPGQVEHLMPEPHHQTIVGVAGLMKQQDVPTMTDLMRFHSLSESQSEKTHQQEVKQCLRPHGEPSGRNGSAHVTFPISISNASSSSSSSSLTGGGPSVSNEMTLNSATTSFTEKRTRHASVPQTASSPGSLSHLLPHKKTGHSSAQKGAPSSANSRPVSIDGTNIALRLKKSQIDKASKDKQCKVFGDDFNVTLFMTKPRNQSDDLLDYCLQEPDPTSHRITVTPVSLSASRDNLLDKKLAPKNTKAKSKTKSRISLRNFNKKNDSSSDEEQSKFSQSVTSTHPVLATLPKNQSLQANLNVNAYTSGQLVNDSEIRQKIPPGSDIEIEKSKRSEEKTFARSDWI